MMVMLRRFVVAFSFILLSGGSVSAQSMRGWDATGLQLTRAELLDLVAQFEEVARSSAYSGALRAQARDEVSLIQERLREGDMRVGDRVLLEVENRTALSDTFNVVAGRKLVLPDIGEIPLEGVLRSELQGHLTKHIAAFIRDPVVRARSLVRIEIFGAVGNAGFYTIPSDILLTDALMLAGGPQPNAKLDKMRIERLDDVIWDGERLQKARNEGRTLDQLSIRAGDRIVVPAQQSRLARLQNVLYIVTALTSLLVIGKQVGVY